MKNQIDVPMPCCNINTSYCIEFYTYFSLFVQHAIRKKHTKKRKKYKTTAIVEQVTTRHLNRSHIVVRVVECYSFPLFVAVVVV